MRKICVFTGTRADYGLLKPLLDAVTAHPNLQLQLLVSGMHLEERFGLTYQHIQEDGFTIDAKVKILGDDDSTEEICHSMARGLARYPETFKKLSPDLLVVLGDRFEAFSVASAALICRLPIAHIHGGECTFGVIDEAIRHSISKMAHLHFTTTDSYRSRVIQLGEHPKRVFNVGSLGVEHIIQSKLISQLLSKEDLQRSLEFNLEGQFALVTYHPETLSQDTEQHADALMSALDQFKQLNIIFTRSNADTDGSLINAHIEHFIKENPKRACCFTSMGQTRYLSALNCADIVIGNSSSGIIEAPQFETPTINIGDRQRGRIQAISVINCSNQAQSIVEGISKALSTEFIDSLKGMSNPYQGKSPSAEICETLAQISLDNILLKEFYDLSPRQ